MTTVSRDYERTLLKIVRGLPPRRAEQLVEFARFLQAQRLTEDLLQAEDEEVVEADNRHWEELLATDEGQDLLEKLAEEALAEHEAGKTTPMSFDDDGRLKRE